jgi:hypothetical protein
MISSRPNRPPINDNIVIWRYLNDSAVERIFSPTNKNFIRDVYPFSRIDSFSDLREGRFSPSQLASQVATLKLHSGWPDDNFMVAEHIKLMINMAEQGRHCLGVSCWFADTNENAAMWDRYASNGLAIKTTVGKLISSLNNKPYFGWIGSVDYRHQIGKWDMLDAAFAKCEEFNDEKEIRVVIAKTENPNSSYASSGPGDRKLDTYSNIKVNWETLIDKIIFSPNLDESREKVWKSSFSELYPNAMISNSILSEGYSYMSDHVLDVLSKKIITTIENSNNPQKIADNLLSEFQNKKN